MQDFQSIPGPAGRIFGGSTASDLRRAMAAPYTVAGVAGDTAGAEAVKCPRCESTNTKFCYYNNYNLSQPRHFCKNCRRYWTKGGVLRNVPVGGGCRKTKRSSSSSASTTTSSSSAPAGGGSVTKNHRRAAAAAGSSRSSSGSPSPTTTTAAAAAVSSSANAATIINHSKPTPNPNPDPNPFLPDVLTPATVPPPPPPPTAIFSDQVATFSSFLAPPPPPPPLFTFSAQPKAGGIVSVFAEQPVPAAGTAAADMTLFTVRSGGGSGGGVMAGIDWPPSVDAGIFELAGAVDMAAYWNPGGSWTDPDPTLYLP